MAQNRLSGLNPLAYMGVEPTSPSQTLFFLIPPTTNDNKFEIGTIWIDRVTNNIYQLSNLDAGVATWVIIGAANGDVIGLTADVGGQALPALGNINVLGDAVNITTTKTAANTITVSLNDSILLPATNNAGTSGVIYIGGEVFVSGYDQIFPKTNSFSGGAGNLTLNLATRNTGVGTTALSLLNNGTDNTAVGAASGEQLTDGIQNTLIGFAAGTSLTTGRNNTAVGYGSLSTSITDDENTAIGSASLFDLDGGAENTALGKSSLAGLTTSNRNTGIGHSALESLFDGDNNIALGFNAGGGYNAAESNNICIGNAGINGESGVIRLGSLQTETFIAGIDGVNVGSVATVVTEAGDQLGTAVITAGAGITVTPGANTITITATTAPFTWAAQAVNANIVAFQGYIGTKAGLLTMTLPAVSAIGDSFAITGTNAGGWSIAQNANQQIHIGLASTTIGVGGSLSSSATRDSAEFICVVAGAGAEWNCVNFVGNLTVV